MCVCWFALQLISFIDVFLRHTEGRTVLCIVPVNTLQNWLAEFNMWLPNQADPRVKVSLSFKDESGQVGGQAMRVSRERAVSCFGRKRCLAFISSQTFGTQDKIDSAEFR